MWLGGMMISDSIRLEWRFAMPMPTEVGGVPRVFLKVENFTVHIKVFWGFQVRVFYIID